MAVPACINIAGVFPLIEYCRSMRSILVIECGYSHVGLMFWTVNLMRPKKSARFDTVRLDIAPRCSARSKRSGEQCRGPAVHGKRVCRMHGGAVGSGGPSGKGNGRYRHGGCTREAKALVSDLNLMARLLKGLPR